MSLFTWLKNTSFKITNFLIGQTPLFIILLGWFFVITGILFLAQPEKARKKLLGQGFGFVMGFVKIFVIYIAIVLIGITGKLSGIFAFIITIAAVILIFRLFLTVKKKTFEKFEKKFALIPLPALIAYSWIQVAVGTLMIMLHKRIW